MIDVCDTTRIFPCWTRTQVTLEWVVICSNDIYIYMLENLIPSPKETKSLLEWRVTLGSHLGGYTITGIELENWSLIPLLWNIWWCRSARQRSYKTLQNQCVIFKF